MADISQLEVNGTTYNICDATARNSLSNYVLKSGDTMTGTLNVQSQVIDRDGDLPESNQYSGFYYIRDINNEVLGYLSGFRFPSGQTGLQVYGTGEYNGAGVATGFRMGADSEGNAYYGFSHPSAFRRGLGAVSNTGDTITGTIALKSSNMDRDGSNPSADTGGSALYNLLDKDDELLGQINTMRRTDGRQDLRLYAYNEKSDGTQVSTTFQMRLDRSGNTSYFLTDATAFREAISAPQAANNLDAVWGNLGSTNQVWQLTATVNNENNATYNGKRLGLIVSNSSFGLYNFTGGASVWSINPATITSLNTATTTTSGGCTRNTTNTNSLTTCNITVCGHVLMFDVVFAVKALSSTSTNYTLGTITKANPPYLMYCQHASSQISYAYVGSGGDIVVRPSAAISAGTEIRLTGMYLTSSLLT